MCLQTTAPLRHLQNLYRIAKRTLYIYIIIPKCACVCLFVQVLFFYLKTVNVNDLILFAT